MSTKKSKIKPAKVGMCALLGIEGTFAKSHLIPQALTRHDNPGENFIEIGRGSRPQRRYTSWYDPELVTLEGEKILSDIDSDGISELRKHKLIWSGWGDEKKLVTDDMAEDPPHEENLIFRNIKGLDVAKLNLFFLSLLWRALSTSLKEFSHLENIGIDLREIGEHIKHKIPCSPEKYPICLVQMNTLGFTHNYAPTIKDGEFQIDDKLRDVTYYRFYMQGIIVHIYPKGYHDLFLAVPAIFLGGKDEMLILTRRFENSRQFNDAKDMIIETSQKFPRHR